MPLRWYAVHTLSGSKEKAVLGLKQRMELQRLDDRFGRILVPSETVVDPKTKRKTTRRFYPGYILVEMELDNETFHLVKNTPRITGFVGATRNPPPVPDHEVEKITKMLAGEEEEPRPVVDFELGEEVRLTEGRYASMRGTIDEINEARGKLRVIINMFGRPVPTELSFHQVEKLNESALARQESVMAKKVVNQLKLQIPAGQARPAPPVGPALGQYGVNIKQFCDQFNDRTKEQMRDQLIIPVVITVYADRSFTFITKTPPTATLLLKAAGIKKGSGEPNRNKVGSVTDAQIEDIAKTKMPDLNCVTIEAAKEQVRGTAVSMGLTVNG